MVKKPKKNKIPLLSFLLRELKGRPIPDDYNEKKNKEDIDIYAPGIAELGGKKSGASLISLLLRDFRSRPAPEEIKACEEEESVTIEDLEDDEDEMDDEKGSLKPQSRKSLGEGRYEVLPSKGIEEDYQKRVRESGRYLDPTGTSKTRLDGDNYRQMYLDQKAQEQALAEEMAKEQLEAQKKAASSVTYQNSSDQQKEVEMKYRARDLQMQIEYWKGQRGQGTFDDVTVNTNLTKLEYELNSIPPTFWRF